MDKKTVLSGVLALVALAGFFFWLRPFSGVEENGAALGTLDTEESSIEIAVDHFFDNGTHSVAGTLDLPTPCHEVVASTTVGKDVPVPVLIALTTEKKGDICTQVISSKLWGVQFEAPQDAVITGTLDGKPVRFIFKTGGAEGAAIEKL